MQVGTERLRRPKFHRLVCFSLFFLPASLCRGEKHLGSQNRVCMRTKLERYGAPILFVWSFPPAELRASTAGHVLFPRCRKPLRAPALFTARPGVPTRALLVPEHDEGQAF